MKNPTPPSNGIARFIPGLALFKGMNPALLRSEFVVAITVFAVLVPSAMAFGDLAGVTPVAGLYVALGAMVMYALFGSSKLVITGPEATSAILTATAVAPLAGGDPVRYAALAALTAILVGVMALLARVARLGFITDFLSKPILVGYIFGATLIVIGSQLGKMFGIKLESRQVLPAGPGAHQPPRRSAPAHRRPGHRLHGGAAHHAPRESRLARPAHRRRGCHYPLCCV